MSILNPKFHYTPAHVHATNPNYLRDKFRRMLREMQQNKVEVEKKVSPMTKRVAK